MAERNVKDDSRDDSRRGNRADDRGDRDPVKVGGIAPTDADAEDVTRDTYGFAQSEPDAPTAEERFAQAERAAEEAGIPGIVTPDDQEG